METWILILAIVVAPDKILYDPAFKTDSQETCWKKSDSIRQMRADVVQTFCVKRKSL